MAHKKTTIYLNLDTNIVVKMHRAEHPHLSSTSHAINDIIDQFSRSKGVLKGDASPSLDAILSMLAEQQSSIQQLTVLSLRNFGLNIEIASETNSTLPSRGEQRAKGLLRQLQDKNNGDFSNR
ncbi:hypothetical protein [Paraglaciecola sp. MB-3u-78]|uniref:hypothetical protein n=1 Tax=Paraglaciecola sp. MB-3u-78 TaxID=2058332 RepID=UPI000C335AB6|nr:hypothetical protein [Paraglaciecola sp. MB-3u-78]PKG95995.1 hypothetical protein CXF95_25365 [Paraglaciecola sp. MB-3u-78]